MAGCTQGYLSYPQHRVGVAKGKGWWDLVHSRGSLTRLVTDENTDSVPA